MDLSFTYYTTLNDKQFNIRCFVYFTQIDHIYQAPTLSPLPGLKRASFLSPLYSAAQLVLSERRTSPMPAHSR